MSTILHARSESTLAWNSPASITPSCIAEAAERSLIDEVGTWPKPGLVSTVDSGSHSDMDAAMFHRSAVALRPFFARLADAGARGQGMDALRRIGISAERAMEAATGGVNTHRGAIFGLGLLSAAAGMRGARSVGLHHSLGDIVLMRWGHDILAGPRLADSHGETVKRRYGAGGARQEAAEGFPAVYRIGLPALRAGLTLAKGDRQAARVHCCFSLIAELEDTNLLHRGGEEGLRFAQCSAQEFIDRGGVGQENWIVTAQQIHRQFVERRLSPGGAADLLAMTLFVDEIEQGAHR